MTNQWSIDLRDLRNLYPEYLFWVAIFQVVGSFDYL